MIPYQNFGIYASVTVLIVIKIVCATLKTYRASMYDNRGILSSIPEKNETDDDILKWVPKTKHEVLKAKYKCLKKLFEIYDANVVGKLPQQCPDPAEPERRHRRKRTHRSKADAGANTTEEFSADVSLSETEKTAAIAIEDFTSHQYSSTDESNIAVSKSVKIDQSTQDFKDVSSSDKGSECIQTTEPHIGPYVVYYERRRASRLQRFISRILGLNTERRHDAPPTGHVYAASDNNITNIYEKRRRRSLRFRRRRPKGIQSEIALRDLKSPKILSYVQSIQKDYLMDTTPRRCPFQGCGMIFYGIINYNDHLNLCHFTDRKYICHYCSEGFSLEYDKIVHENEHIGMTKIDAIAPVIPLSGRSSAKIASNTQTDPEHKAGVPEEKLKKIVSFFDKISYPNQIVGQLKQNNSSDPNIESTQRFATHTEKSMSTESEKGLTSCVHLKKKDRRCETSADCELTSTCVCDHRVTCRFCGEKFNFRRELSLHVDLEHRVHDKYSKFHSCPGFVTRQVPEVVLEDGRINVQSIGAVASQTYSDVSRRKSDQSVKCDPSTNIVYFTSVDSIARKPSAVGSFVKKIHSYKWEPGNKIIHV